MTRTGQAPSRAAWDTILHSLFTRALVSRSPLTKISCLLPTKARTSIPNPGSRAHKWSSNFEGATRTCWAVGSTAVQKRNSRRRSRSFRQTKATCFPMAIVSAVMPSGTWLSVASAFLPQFRSCCPRRERKVRARAGETTSMADVTWNNSGCDVIATTGTAVLNRANASTIKKMSCCRPSPSRIASSGINPLITISVLTEVVRTNANSCRGVNDGINRAAKPGEPTIRIGCTCSRTAAAESRTGTSLVTAWTPYKFTDNGTREPTLCREKPYTVLKVEQAIELVLDMANVFYRGTKVGTGAYKPDAVGSHRSPDLCSADSVSCPEGVIIIPKRGDRAGLLQAALGAPPASISQGGAQ